MIKQIVAQNIFSFKDRISVTFEDISVIFGRNTSGKTNLLSIIHLVSNIATNKIRGGLDILASSVEYRFKEGHDDILIALAFSTCGYDYEIIFKLNSSKGIVSQSLQNIKKMSKSDKKVILYNTEEGQFPFLSKVERERLETYKWDQVSLLEKLNNEFDLSDENFKQHILRVYKFFSEQINFFTYSDNYSIRNAAKRIFDNQSLQKKIINALRALDIPITNITINKQMRPMSINQGNQDDALSANEMEDYTVGFEHQGKYTLNSTFESTGTIKLFGIFSILLDEMNTGETWIFDELENSLHEEIYRILPLLVNKKLHGQIIFTSHNTRLLDTNMLKKRQILIVDKTDDESSEVYSLNEFSDLRTDARNNWQRWYRQNRFGGYPVIDLEKIVVDEYKEDRCDG